MDRLDLPHLEPGVEALFDAVADDYDQAGVSFFVPIATRLVQLADPQPRERALDIGCGRGAATTLLAEAVGPEGRLTAIDLSARMVEHTAALVPTAEALRLDAADPDLPAGAFDVATASLVIFFLPDPRAAAARWLRLLAPGGRLAISTFGQEGELWNALGTLLTPYAPPQMRDPKTVGEDSPFASVERFETLLRDAGAGEVRTTTETITATLEGPEQWLRFSLGTGQRRMWQHVPVEERPEVYARAVALIEDAQRTHGTAELTQEVRYTLARPR